MEVTISSNLTLRPYKISDADDFLTYGGDDRVTRLTRRDNINTKEEAIAFIEQSCIPHPYCRSICLDDRSIGYLYVLPLSGLNQHCTAEVGYMLAAKYWGQGIVAKALKVAITEAFKEFPHLLRMQAHAEVVNKPCHRVLEKLGFQREALMRKWTINKGEVKDIVIFSLLSTDPIL